MPELVKESRPAAPLRHWGLRPPVIVVRTFVWMQTMLVVLCQCLMAPVAFASERAANRAIAAATTQAATAGDKVKAAAHSDQLVKQQVEAINKVPNVQVKTEDMKQEPLEKGPGLNPVAWIFRPLTKLQAQSVRLEQQIMKLTGPIAALQPGILGLEGRITEVRTEMGQVKERMVSVQGDMGKVQGQLSDMQSNIRDMRQQMHTLEGPMRDLKSPITKLQGPLLELQRPVSSIGTRLNNLEEQLSQLRTLIALVLSSIYVAAALIAVGTPLAAILVWRNRRKLLPEDRNNEDQKIARKIGA